MTPEPRVDPADETADLRRQIVDLHAALGAIGSGGVDAVSDGGQTAEVEAA